VTGKQMPHMTICLPPLGGAPFRVGVRYAKRLFYEQRATLFPLSGTSKKGNSKLLRLGVRLLFHAYFFIRLVLTDAVVGEK
jgi:hypothetical protein